MGRRLLGHHLLLHLGCGHPWTHPALGELQKLLSGHAHSVDFVLVSYKGDNLITAPLESTEPKSRIADRWQMSK